MTPIVTSDLHRLHATQGVRLADHPFVAQEIPARAELILASLQDAGVGPVVAPQDHGLGPILAVHEPDYIDFLRHAYAESAAALGVAAPVFPETFHTRRAKRTPRGVLGLKGYYAFGVGSPILEGTWEAAYWSAQCALTASGLVLGGERAAYALCRPPGHHAAQDLYGGACYLNNAAIAVRHVQGSDRIAVLDIDYHHGNGTQEIFYSDPSVLFCSLHAHPDDDYPFYWGEADETGQGAGLGANRNWPLPQRTDDATYLAALDEALSVIKGFAPGCLVVSAGFDLVEGDPLGGFCVSLEGLEEIGQRIARLGLRTVMLQEGGYRMDKLGECAVAFLRAFQ
ncbi:MAG TPA: histone deacetylase family protein [Anaerolineales bacterium]|nr:histone deacetylase family protein [Anaerolineales bacterium]